MNITSELKFTDINTKPEIYNMNYYKDNYTLLYEKGFTDYIMGCPTRYSPLTYCYRGDNIIGVSLAYYGEYTEGELGLLRNFLNPESVVYDIGANIGVHTQAFAKTSKHVYAFEPNYNNFRLLDLNTTHDKNVTLFDYAISDKNGTAKIEQYALGSIGNFGECKLTEVGQDCDTVTIDHLVKTKEILPPSVIKIDVEGHEYPVFQGMIETLKNNLPVILYEAMHCDLKGIYDILNGLGYTLYWFPVPNYNPNNYYKNKENVFGQGGVLNILAVPFHVDAKTNLPTVISRDDTWADTIERVQKLNAKSS